MIALFILLHSFGHMHAAAAIASSLITSQAPTAWPEVFHATMLQNRSSIVSLVDLYYDWPGGLNLNIIQSQLDRRGTLYDIEWNNHTSFYLNRENRLCKRVVFPVGILPPTWLQGAEYLGESVVDGIDVRVFTKVDFITYYESIELKLPVRWVFHDSGMQLDVFKFEIGVRAEVSQYQAPSYCFDMIDGSKESSR